MEEHTVVLHLKQTLLIETGFEQTKLSLVWRWFFDPWAVPLLCVVSLWRTRCCEPEYPSGGPCVTPPDGNPEHHRCRIMSCQSEVQPCVSFQIKPMRSEQILLIYSTSCGLLYKILHSTCHHINASTNRGSSPFPQQPTLLYRIKLGFTVVIA